MGGKRRGDTTLFDSLKYNLSEKRKKKKGVLASHVKMKREGKKRKEEKKVKKLKRGVLIHYFTLNTPQPLERAKEGKEKARKKGKKKEREVKEGKEDTFVSCFLLT